MTKQEEKKLGLTKMLKLTFICLLLSIIVEVFIFNLSHWSSLGLESTSILGDSVSVDGQDYRTRDYVVDGDVSNIQIKLKLTNAQYAYGQVTLTDEGDQYEYDMPQFRIVPEVPETGIQHIHPYGKVHTIRVKVTVPEDATAVIEDVVANAHVPLRVLPLRLILFFTIIEVLMLVWTIDRRTVLYMKKGDKWQLAVYAVMVIMLVMLTKSMTTSNNLIVACPWPHHGQYQELAVALSEGHVDLKDKVVSPELLGKDNPYDTIALLAEGIPYNMDYAYYEGSYYVYFGIIPELVFFYPYYKLTGNQLSNVTVMWLLSVTLIVGIFLCIRQLLFRYGRQIPYLMNLVLAIGVTLFSNHVYMIGRADIYNIPVMMGTACTWLGIGLWLLAVNLILDEPVRFGKIGAIFALLAGSLSMAMVAGARPQMLVYSFAAVAILFAPVFRVLVKDKGQGDVKNGSIISVKYLVAMMLAVATPYIIIAVIVGWYNVARFGVFYDFGATYSLTTNDMNHRGFNLDRLLRGLFCFLFQPANMSTDFPYLQSSQVLSSYMGRNLVEFTFGGAFATNLLLLAAMGPFFGLRKRMNGELTALWGILMVGALVVAGFDVNGAGILYRYTCDFMPGLILAAACAWTVMLDGTSVRLKVNSRLLVVAVLVGLGYSLMVFCASGDTVNLHDNSIVLYESIRSYFRF